MFTHLKPDEPGNPRSLRTWKKWMIVLVSSCASLCVTSASSIYTLTYNRLEAELGVSEEICTLGLSLYTLALGVGPLFVAPLSEFYGRWIICSSSLALYTIWNVPCAVAQNMATELIGRWFSGMCGAAFLTVSGGVVGDLFAPNELQAPMLVYALLSFLGPDLGPLMGGFIDQYYHWRWVFYALIIWSGVLTMVFVLLIPETYAPVLQRSIAQGREKGDDTTSNNVAPDASARAIAVKLAQSCKRPFQLLTQEYMVTCLCLLTAVLLGVQYLIFGAFAYAFSKVYNFSPSDIGMSFLGIGVGAVVAAFTFPAWNAVRRKQLVANNEVSEPEFRLPPAAFGACLLPISLLWFGWTCRPSVHWSVPIVGSGLFGMGGLLIFNGVWTFLVESYPTYAASALGANAFTRLVFAGTFPLFGVQMYENLGIGWASTLLAFIALACVPFPVLFMIYGKRIRAASKWAGRK